MSPGLKKGCAIGCAAVALFGLLAVGGAVSYFGGMMKGFDQAIETRKTVEERYGDRDSFVPWPDGVVPPERLEAFVQVRRALEDLCGRFEATVGQFERMEQEYQDEEPPPREILRAVRGAFGLAPLLADFYQQRNQALLDAEMSLGEYIYIYVLAYYTGSATEEPDRRRVPRRARRAFVRMLQAQLAAMTDSSSEAAEALRGEIEALEAERNRLPWPEGLPPEVAASFEARADEIRELRCPVAAQFELGRMQRRGLSIQNN